MHIVIFWSVFFLFAFTLRCDQFVMLACVEGRECMGVAKKKKNLPWG